MRVRPSASSICTPQRPLSLLQAAFAETAHATRLLEAAAAAVALAEPLLLVGEAGTGKTALLQHLAGKVRLDQRVLFQCHLSSILIQSTQVTLSGAPHGRQGAPYPEALVPT